MWLRTDPFVSPSPQDCSSHSDSSGVLLRCGDCINMKQFEALGRGTLAGSSGGAGCCGPPDRSLVVELVGVIRGHDGQDVLWLQNGGEHRAPTSTSVAIITRVELPVFYQRVPPSNAGEIGKETFLVSLMRELLKWIFLSERFLLLNPFKCVLLPRRQAGNCSEAPGTHLKVQYSVSHSESA